MRTSIVTTILSVAAATVFSAFIARAAERDPRCVANAAHEMGECRAACREQFQTDKDLCRNIDHDCAETCREDFVGCLEAPDGPLTQLEACRLICSDTLSNAVDACRNQYAAGTPERDQCIDGAQVAAFVCRDNCREDSRDGFAACRRSFRVCIGACPPPA
jgi:hypothetical protein